MKSQSVQEIVNRVALVCRRYILRDYSGFAKEFQGIDNLTIRNAWSNALSEVKDDEIIEASSRREITEFIGRGIISEVVGKPEYKDDETNFTYLLSKFDDSTLNLAEEDREREIRRLLAYRYFLRSRAAALAIQKEFDEVTVCK